MLLDSNGNATECPDWGFVDDLMKNKDEIKSIAEVLKSILS